MKGYNKTPPDYAKLAKPKGAPAKKATGGLGSLMGNASDYMAASSPKAAPKAAPRAAAKPVAKASAQKAAPKQPAPKAAAKPRVGVAGGKRTGAAGANRGYSSYKDLMED
jgi:hypothetical protein